MTLVQIGKESKTTSKLMVKLTKMQAFRTVFSKPGPEVARAMATAQHTAPRAPPPPRPAAANSIPSRHAPQTPFRPLHILARSWLDSLQPCDGSMKHTSGAQHRCLAHRNGCWGVEEKRNAEGDTTLLAATRRGDSVEVHFSPTA